MDDRGCGVGGLQGALKTDSAIRLGATEKAVQSRRHDPYANRGRVTEGYKYAVPYDLAVTAHPHAAPLGRKQNIDISFLEEISSLKTLFQCLH